MPTFSRLAIGALALVAGCSAAAPAQLATDPVAMPRSALLPTILPPIIPTLPAAAPQAVVPPPRAASPTPSVPTSGPVTLTVVEDKATDHQRNVSVDVPRVTAVSGLPPDSALAVRDWVASTVNAALAEPPAGLAIGVNVSEADDSYVTVALDESFDGGAHPEAATSWRTFDRATGATVTLATLAAPGQRTPLLLTLSGAVRSAPVIKAALADPTYAATAKQLTGAGNLANVAVFPRTDGLAVSIDFLEGEASGQTIVVVPWSQLAASLAPGAVPTSAVPAPAARSGELAGATFFDTGITAAVSASKLPALAGFVPGTYTLAGSLRATAGTTDWLVVQLIPNADPTHDLTLGLAGDGPSITTAGHGAAGCVGIPAQVRTTMQLAC